MNYNLDLLKEVLSVPTKTYKEDKMVEYLTNWLTENNIEFFVDAYKNVYATKKDNTPKDENFFYPCVVSHTDTVHELDSIFIQEQKMQNAQGELKDSLFALNASGKPTGIGGDDKCGVFACLTLLQELPNLKAAFFVSEETGCHGSQKANVGFFANVGYAIQFDAPENWMVTEKCFGQVLFDRDSEFFEKCDEVLSESMDPNFMEYMVHPYTDVYALRKSFDISCINFSIGYYNYHTRNEYVVIEDVYKGIDMGKKMIDSLGNKLHYKKKKDESKSYTLWN